MEFFGKLKSVTRDVMTGAYDVTFATNDVPASVVDQRKDDVLLVKADKPKRKRSLDSNAYCWLLISKIADKIHSSKEEVYEQMLIRYGQPFINENGAAQMITVRADIDIKPFGLYTKLIGSGHVDGKEFSHYVVFRGSHTYDTKEMSIFIDGVVSEAKELGIDHIPLIDLEKMKKKWNI